jgi:hypothetical protein
LTLELSGDADTPSLPECKIEAALSLDHPDPTGWIAQVEATEAFKVLHGRALRRAVFATGDF